MPSENNTPAIRFAGFTGEWERRKIKEIAHLITKGTTPLNKSKNGEVNFVKIENIDKESGEIYITQKISKEEHEGYLRRSQLRKNDILFSIAGTLGRVTYVKPAILPANTNQALAIIRTQEGNTHFITTFLKGKAVEEFIRKNPTTGAQPNLSLEQVSNIHVSLPCEAEQSSISAYFQELNTLITLHRRKCELLETLKKSMLEKLFPKEGELVPELRFAGFTGEWERRKLGEISDIKTGPFGSTLHAGDYVSNGVPIITTEHFKYGILPQEKGDLPQVSHDDYNRLYSYVLNDGDLVFSRVGSVDVNAVVMSPQVGWLFSGRVLRVRPTKKCCPYFLHTLLETEAVRRDIRGRAVGQTMPCINTEILKITNVKFPTSLCEQEMIARYFQKLDTLISLHRRKLEHLQNIKKACLEKMFV